MCKNYQKRSPGEIRFRRFHQNFPLLSFSRAWTVFRRFQNLCPVFSMPVYVRYYFGNNRNKKVRRKENEELNNKENFIPTEKYSRTRAKVWGSMAAVRERNLKSIEGIMNYSKYLDILRCNWWVWSIWYLGINGFAYNDAKHAAENAKL